MLLFIKILLFGAWGFFFGEFLRLKGFSRLDQMMLIIASVILITYILKI